MLLVGARLAYLQTSQHDWLSRRARVQQSDEEPLQAPRGLILDRQGRELARSIDVDSFYADPREIEDVEAASAALARVLNMDSVGLSARLKEAKSARRGFLWLARKVEDEQSRAVKALKLKGVYSARGAAAALPERGTGGARARLRRPGREGLAGVEQVYNASLTGEEGSFFSTPTRSAGRSRARGSTRATGGRSC